MFRGLNRQSLSFYIASLALITLFAASSSPIPLYSIYQQRIDLSTGTISLTAGLYFIGCILSLLVLSKLANSFGRKKISLVALLLGIAGLLLLLGVQSPTILLLARFFQGLSCGLGSSVLSTYIHENGQEKHPILTKAMMGAAVFVGLALGSVLSGSIVKMNPNSIEWPYLILLSVLLFCLIGLSLGTATKTRATFEWQQLFPTIHIERKAKALFPIAVCIFGGTWVMGGYFQAFSSTITRTVFQLDNPLVSALILSAFMVPNFIGATISNRFSTIAAKKYGLFLFTICIVLMYWTTEFRNLGIYLVLEVMAGVFQGICSTVTMQELIQSTTEAKRTELLSAIYLVSYGSAAIPNLLVSQFSSDLSFQEITLGYLFIVIAMFLLMMILLRSSKHQ